MSLSTGLSMLQANCCDYVTSPVGFPVGIRARTIGEIVKTSKHYQCGYGERYNNSIIIIIVIIIIISLIECRIDKIKQSWTSSPTTYFSLNELLTANEQVRLFSLTKSLKKRRRTKRSVKCSLHTVGLQFSCRYCDCALCCRRVSERIELVYRNEMFI